MSKFCQFFDSLTKRSHNRVLVGRQPSAGWFESGGNWRRYRLCFTHGLSRYAANVDNHIRRSQAKGSPSIRSNSLADNLDEHQLAAALTTERIVRIKAGPGSGKTRVVVGRIHHLITRMGVDPRRILAITFTNKAANELKGRLRTALGGDAGGSDVGDAGTESRGGRSSPGPQVLAKTFHGLGLHLLRKSLEMRPDLASELALTTELKVVNADQGWRVLKKAVEAVEQQQQQQQTVAVAATSRAGIPGRSSRNVASRAPLPELSATALSKLVDILSSFFSDCKPILAAREHHEDSTAMLQPVISERRERMLKKYVNMKELPEAVYSRLQDSELVQSYFSAYRQQLQLNNAADFDDLICLTVRILDLDPNLRNYWQASFDHILADEFQDTDPAQYRMLARLLGPSSGLFVVGDPDQAIYSWRGAEVNNMRDYLPRDFPGTATFHLPVNYRTVPDIVNIADAVLRDGEFLDLYKPQVPARKALAPHSVPSQPAVSVHTYPDPEREAEEIVKLIVKRSRSLRHGGGSGGGSRMLYGLDDVAVLYRRRDQSRPLEEALTQRGVPYVVVGGKPFWEYKEIADVVSYLHVVRDPLCSDVLLERIINEPKRGLGPAAIGSLREAARGAGLTLGGLLFGDFCDDIGEFAPKPETRASSSIPPPGVHDAADYAPEVQAGSPLSAVKLKKPALQGIKDLRGLIYRVGQLAVQGETVERLLVATLRLSGYLGPLEHAREAGEAGSKAAGAGARKSAKKKADTDIDNVATEKLERLESLRDVAARPETWLAAGGGEEDEEEEEEEEEEDDSGGVGRNDDGEEEEAPSDGGSRGSESPQPQRRRQRRRQQGMRRGRRQKGSGRGLKGLSEFLEHAALVMGADTEPGDKANVVHLMTLHASKGLEFPWVFILGLEDGVLPSSRAEDLAEERRLFYVGITRAEDRLFLSRCERRFNYTEWKQSQPSPFLRALNVLGKHAQRSVGGGERVGSYSASAK
ncbi:hypothetical protein VaNZ11_009146 [Volvox africanus]|uniref:DNA 3'-5' helicase n=1 Tax=Volvox africanus TaxID=51714 RepID=A0ABQ5S7D9_9CHLO|nr:hypothetical protein VaNZ11_009146 [Volvox africanus]